MSTKKQKRDREEKKKKKKPTPNILDGEEDVEEEETWTKERVEKLKRDHDERYDDLFKDYKRISHEACLARNYPKHKRLIDWLGGPEKAFPDPFSSHLARRLMGAKHRNDEAERMVQNTLALLLGKRPVNDAVDSVNGWMDVLENGEDIDLAIDLFIKMMRILEEDA